MGTLRSQDFLRLPIFWRVELSSQKLRILPSKRNIKWSLLTSMKNWSFQHSIEPSDGNRVQFREQLAPKSRRRQWPRSGVQETTIWLCQHGKSHTIDQIEFKYNSCEATEQVDWRNLLQQTEWSCPRIGNTHNRWWSFEVIPRSTMFHHRVDHSYDYIPSISAKCTYLSCCVHRQLYQRWRKPLAEVLYSHVYLRTQYSSEVHFRRRHHIIKPHIQREAFLR
jgi:hypothetical protein